MADKLDFMSELAKSVDAKKRGETSSFGTIDDFVPRNRNVAEEEYEPEPQTEPRRKPRPSKPEPQPEPVSEPEEYEEEEYEEGEEYEEEEEPGSSHNMYETSSASPASFAQEERVKVEKPQFRLTGPMIGGMVAALALLLFLIWFFALRSPIVLPDFTGKTLSEVSAWAAQNKIESTAIARTYEYSLEYDSDVVISQTPAGGKRVKKNTPITFTVSQGADPNEEIPFPDIRSMTYEELTEWKNENKLTKTKISTEYSTTVENGGVIEYVLKNVSENEFTRGSTLTIRCSKGPAPAGQVTVENFTGKNYAEAVTWANSKKLKVVREEMNSDTADSGVIIAQNPKAGSSMSEGDTFTITVSKGKGVKIPNLVGYTKEQLEAWSAAKENNVVIVKKSVYNEAPLGSVIAQDRAPGSVVDAGDVLQLTISLYMPILETNSRAWLGKDYLELHAWCDDVNYNGADIQAGMWGDWQYPTCSDEYPTPGQIVRYACYYGTSDQADGCGRPLNNYSRINYQISSGACTVKPSSSEGSSESYTPSVTPTTPSESVTPSSSPSPSPDAPKQIAITSANIMSLVAINTFCNENKMSCTYTPAESPAEGDPKVTVTFTDINGKEVTANSKDTGLATIVKEGAEIKVTYIGE